MTTLLVQRVLVLVIGLSSSCLGYKLYQHDIPNGESVPHPCKPNYIWQGVGHQSVLGGGARNPFGLAFVSAGKHWTEDLCNADSDGDGMSNGEELGDPSCIWTAGSIPEQSVGLSHPGVCEPTDSANCTAKNAWDVDCSIEDFYCTGIEDPDTVNLTLLFDRKLVPAQETTYMCQTFDIPSDKEYHLFASKPEIDNPYVMHHTIVYGCTETPPTVYDAPSVCGMYTAECETVIGGWTLGQNGECQRETDGLLVGKGHYTKVMVEHHWNNPRIASNYYDSSGITLFLTPNLRVNNVATFSTGQESLKIPPGLEYFTVSGICPSDCVDRKLNNSVYITSASLHMHYLGAAGKIEHWRNGQLLNTWFDESEYSYDLPVNNVFDSPIELMKGDEIKTSCTFKSTSRSEETVYGLATSDEMCYGFMTYYPADKDFTECVSYDDYDSCEIEDFFASDAVSVHTVSLSFLMILVSIAIM